MIMSKLSRAASVAAALAVCGLAFPSAGFAGWTGKASSYNLKSKTASGGRVGHMTAAHRTLPFGAKLRVTNLANKRSVVVTVNDRGPFIGGRVLDLSKGAAAALGFIRSGHTKICMERS